MAGFMDYRRFRSRNGLTHPPADERDPYPRAWHFFATLHRWQRAYLSGELNRMERDYLGTGHPPYHDGTTLLSEIEKATGVPQDVARKVLAFVFAGEK